MKKKILIISIILIILASIGGFLYYKKNNDNKEYLKLIEFAELQEKINNQDTFILVLTRTDCVHCSEYKPILKNILKEYNITAYQVEIDLLSSEEKGQLKDIANISGTPTTIFIENGKENGLYNRIVGTSTTSKIKERLKKMGYIKE